MVRPAKLFFEVVTLLLTLGYSNASIAAQAPSNPTPASEKPPAGQTTPGQPAGQGETPKSEAATSATTKSLPESLTTEDTRMTVGISSDISSGAAQSAGFMMDFALTAPLGRPVTREIKPGFGAWMNARFAGQAQKSAPSIKQFLGGFENSVASGSLTDVVQAVDVLIGGEVRITKRDFTFGGDYQLQPLFFFGGGFTTTPPRTSQPPVFVLTPEAADRFIPDADEQDYKFIGFVQPDRRSFDRQFYVGLRLRTHHFKHCEQGDVECNEDERVNFPGTIDVSFGRHSAVSGGSFGSASNVFRLEAFYPLPTNNRANAIYVFGSAFLHLKRLSDEEPIFLTAPSAAVPVPSPELYLHTLTGEERKRDAWRFGIAVDLVRLFKKAADVKEPSAASEAVGTLVSDSAKLDIRRVVLRKGDSWTLSNKRSFAVALDAGSVVREIAGVAQTASWTLGAIEVVNLDKTSLRNVGTGALEALVITPKASLGTSGAAIIPITLVLKGAEREESAALIRTDLVAERLEFKSAGSANGKIEGGSVALIPLTETGATLKTVRDKKDSTTVLMKGVPVILDEATEFEIATTKGAQIVVVTLR